MAQAAAMAGSTRKIHVLRGAVHVILDHGCTAGDIIERVQATLPDQPYHGHTLLSSGMKKFQHSDVVSDGNHLAFANYSFLARPGRLQIPTERSGITIPQIQALLDFVHDMIGVSEPGLWAGSFGDERGKPLSFDTFNLYHAVEWIILPAAMWSSWQMKPMLRCLFGSFHMPGLSQSSCFWLAFVAMQTSGSYA